MKRQLSSSIRTLSLSLLFSLAGTLPGAVGLRSEVDSCQTAVAKDDGSVESGYGFVPTATTGTYVQAFDRSELKGTHLYSVCLCFMKTRPDQDINFEVVVFGDNSGQPAVEPIAIVPGSQAGVATSKKSAGEFIEVELPNVALPKGTVYIGARWNPSEEKFLFICNDQTESSPKTLVFFSEDQTPNWTSVLTARDPLFLPHRAIMVRANSSTRPAELKATVSSAPEPPSP